jgi:hypothetical protein
MNSLNAKSLARLGAILDTEISCRELASRMSGILTGAFEFQRGQKSTRECRL